MQCTCAIVRLPVVGSRTKAQIVALSVVTVLCALFAPCISSSAEFSVTSETIGQAYRIRGRDGLFSIPRSRITQLLFLHATDLLSVHDDLDMPMDLGLDLSLGLDHDFGVQDASLEPGNDGFVPLLARTDLGMFTGHISGRFGLDPRFGFELGRLVLLDPAGFVAMDGLHVELGLFGILEMGFAMGLELLPDVRLTMVDFSPEGVAWGNRRGYPEALHPEIVEPRLRPVIATSVGVRVPWAGTLTLSYHCTWADPEFLAVAMERLGLGLELSGFGRPLSAVLRASYDLVHSRMAEMEAQVTLRPAPGVGFGLRFVHYVPLFDACSIFSVFAVDPHDELGTFVDMGSSRSPLALSAGVALRLTTPQDQDGSRLSDVNAQLVAHVRASLFDLAWTASGSGGQSGILAGTTARADLALLEGRLVPGIGAGLWFFSDPLRRDHHGLTAGASAMLTAIPVDLLRLVAGVDLFSNRVSGTGLSASVRILVEL